VENKENHAENFFRKNAENYVQMSAVNTKTFKVYRIIVKKRTSKSYPQNKLNHACQH